MARLAAWTLVLCAIAAGASAKTLPVSGGRRQGQANASTPPATAQGPLQARNADIPLLGTVTNIIGGDAVAVAG